MLSKKVLQWYIDNTPLQWHLPNSNSTQSTSPNLPPKLIHAYLASGYLPAKQLLQRISFHDKLSNVVRLQGFVEEVERLILSAGTVENQQQNVTADEDATTNLMQHHKTVLSLFGASDSKLRETRWKWIKQFIRRNVPRKFTDQILMDGTDDLIDLIAERNDKRAQEQFLSNLYIVVEEMMPPNLKVLGEVKQQAIQQKIDELHNDAMSEVYSDYISPKRLNNGNKRGMRRRSPKRSLHNSTDNVSTIVDDAATQHLSPMSAKHASQGANGSFLSGGSSTPMSTSPVNNGGSSQKDPSFAHEEDIEQQHIIAAQHNVTHAMRLEDARNCMEFLIITLCDEFQLDTSQGVALLTSKGDELNDIVVDNSNTEYILSWYHTIKSNMSQLITLLQRDPSSIRLCLAALSKGLQADSSEIALCVLDILSIFATHFLSQEDFAIHFWKWFIVFQGGLDLILFALNRHRYKAPRVTESSYSIIFQYSKTHLMDLFQNHLPKRLDEDDFLVEFCTEWTEYILQTYPSSKMALADQNVLPIMFNYALRAANPAVLKETDSHGKTSSFSTTTPTAEKTFVAAIHLCIFLWKEYPLAVETVKSDIVNRVRFAILKSSSDAVRTDVHEEMFQLLIHLAHLRDKNAAFIQKVLMESLKRHFKDRVVRSYLLKNFSLLLKQSPKFPPKKILVLYTKLSSTKDTVASSDFEFLNRVAVHQFLKWSHASILINHIAGIALGIELPQHADAAQATLLLLLSRFKSYPEAVEVVSTITQRFANIITTNELNLSEESQECALQCMEHILKKNYSTLSSTVMEIIREAHETHPDNTVLRDLVAQWNASNREEILSQNDSDDSEMDLNQLELDSDDEAFFESDPTPRQPPVAAPAEVNIPTSSGTYRMSSNARTKKRVKPSSSHLPQKNTSALPRIHERRVASQKSSRTRSREERTNFVSPSHSEPLPNIRDRFSHLSPQQRLLERRKAEIIQRKEERDKRQLEENLELERQRQKNQEVAKKLRAKYERRLSRSRKPLYAHSKPPLGPRTRNGRHLFSRESAQGELTEAEQVSLEIVDGIMKSVTQQRSKSRYRSPALNRHVSPASKQTPGTPRQGANHSKASPSPYRRQSLQPASTKFFSQFPADQRKSALFCRKIVDEIIKKVVSGKASMEIEFKMRQMLERRKKRAQWEKNKEKLLGKREETLENGDDAEKESAIKKHEQQLEQMKQEKEARRREREKKKLEAQKERNKKLQLQLEAHKKQKEEELQKKLEEERQQAQLKKEEQKKKQEMIKKKREEKKRLLEEYKKKVEDERKRQEEEEEAKRKAEKEKKQSELEEFKKRQKKKEMRLAKSIASAITIQRVYRGYLTRKRLQEKKKKKKFIKPNIEKYAGASAKPFSITVFRNNDRFHQGTVVDISPLRFKTFEDLIAYLSMEVQHITGPILKLFNMEGDRVTGINGLVPEGKYLCVGGERVDPRQSIPLKIAQEFHYKRPKRTLLSPQKSPPSSKFTSPKSESATPKSTGTPTSRRRSFGQKKLSAKRVALAENRPVVQEESTPAAQDSLPTEVQGQDTVEEGQEVQKGDTDAVKEAPANAELSNSIETEPQEIAPVQESTEESDPEVTQQEEASEPQAPLQDSDTLTDAIDTHPPQTETEQAETSQESENHAPDQGNDAQETKDDDVPLTEVPAEAKEPEAPTQEEQPQTEEESAAAKARKEAWSDESANE